MSASRDDEKRRAADAASELVHDGMRVGLGTGTTTHFVLAALARQAPRAVYVASSPRTHELATDMGLDVRDFGEIDYLDLAIDGADQIAPDGWLIKGGGGAHAREKIIAASTDRFIVVADASKCVDVLHQPIPLELSPFATASTLRRLGTCVLRDVAPSPDGGIIADYYSRLDAPEDVAQWLAGTPGVIAHGLFAPSLVNEIFVGVDRDVRHTITGGLS